MATEFETAYAALCDVQERYSGFGASDTEPRAVFSSLLSQVCDGRDPDPVPTDARGWQLFSDEPGADGVARKMARAAERALDAARRDPIGAASVMGWH